MASDTSGQWHAPSSPDQDQQCLYRGCLPDIPTCTPLITHRPPFIPRAAWAGGAGLTIAGTRQGGQEARGEGREHLPSSGSHSWLPRPAGAQAPLVQPVCSVLWWTPSCDAGISQEVSPCEQCLDLWLWGEITLLLLSVGSGIRHRSIHARGSVGS